MSSTEKDCPFRNIVQHTKTRILGDISHVVKETENNMAQIREMRRVLHKQARKSLTFYREQITQALDSISLNQISNSTIFFDQIKKNQNQIAKQLNQLKNYNNIINTKWNNIENTRSNHTDEVDPLVLELFRELGGCRKRINNIRQKQENDETYSQLWQQLHEQNMIIERKVFDQIKSVVHGIFQNDSAQS